MNRFGVALVLGLPGLSGCAETHVIRPTQLAVLNDDITTSAGISKALKFETANGRVVELNTPITATITVDGGQQLYACSPMKVSFSGGEMFIRHACGSPIRVAGSDIVKVEIEGW